jgi:hypothetical protein
MTAPKGFIARWSRRKLAASEDTRTQAPPVSSPPPCGEGLGVGVVGAPLVGAHDKEARPQGPPLQTPLPSPPPQGGREQSEFSGSAQDPTASVLDLTKLPPIESITAATDIRPYLARGVPPELTRAALRRAWAADPAIRDFIGLAENAWDFNAPDAMEGFGPLELTDELRREIAAMVGRGFESQHSTDPHPTGLPSLREVKSVDPGSSPALPLSGVTESVAPLVSANDGSSQIEHKGATQRDAERSDDASQAPQRRHGSALPQ